MCVVLNHTVDGLNDVVALMVQTVQCTKCTISNYNFKSNTFEATYKFVSYCLSCSFCVYDYAQVNFKFYLYSTERQNTTEYLLNYGMHICVAEHSLYLSATYSTHSLFINRVCSIQLF